MLLEVAPTLESVNGSLVGIPTLSIECEAFSGSLAAMFVAVRKHKLVLCDVPLAPICAAYLDYLNAQEQTDLESFAAGTALLAYFVEKKVVFLTDGETDEVDDEENLAPLESTVHEFDGLIQELLERDTRAGQRYYRTTDGSPYEMPYDFGKLSASDLALALEALLKQAKPNPVASMGRPRRSLADQMAVVLRAMSREWRTLDAIVEGDFTRHEAVWWFLALLELVRLKQVAVRIDENQIEFALETDR